MDRRAARTRASLEAAHMSLILEQDYEAVSVEAICRRADVARSTFYAHYAGKDDLKRAGLDHLRAELLAAQAAGEPFAFVPRLFGHAQAHRAHFRARVGGRGGALALGRIREILVELARAELARLERGETASDLAPAAKVQYAVGALMGLLVWWLGADEEATPLEMGAAFQRLMISGLLAPALDCGVIDTSH